MVFAGIVNSVRTHLARRADLNRLLAEANALNERELADRHTSRAELRRKAYASVYGTAEAAAQELRIRFRKGFTAEA